VPVDHYGSDPSPAGAGSFLSLSRPAPALPQEAQDFVGGGPNADMKPYRTPSRLSLVAVLALALAIVPSAAPAPRPLLQLGPIVIANGTAGIAGTVSTSGARTVVTVNGHRLGLDVSGAFHGVVPLNGATVLAIAITELGGKQQTQYTIPLTGVLLGVGGVIPGNVLDSLEQAGISLLAPVRSASGGPLTVSGVVLDPSQLVTLTVNGVNILGALQPNGTFSVQLPGTTTVVTVAATDAKGNTQKQTMPALLPPSSNTVAASQAVGVRIAKVRFVKAGSLRTHRLRMIVTVKDRRGRLVRGAKIRVRSTRSRRLVRQPLTKLSGRRGKATFALRLRATAYGKRLVLVTVARTPTAKASRRSVVRVPRRTRAHR
jgi:hypothetical protein